MTALDLTAVALRRDPFTEITGLQIEPATGRIFGLVDGKLVLWQLNGNVLTTGAPDLIPLQKPKREPLRCWVNYCADKVDPFIAAHEDRSDAVEYAIEGSIVVPMIEELPGHALYEMERVEALVAALRQFTGHGGGVAIDAIAAWEAGE